MAWKKMAVIAMLARVPPCAGFARAAARAASSSLARAAVTRAGGGGATAPPSSRSAAATALAASAPARSASGRAVETADVDGDDEVLAALRARFDALRIDALVVPSDDPHLSECVRRALLFRTA